MVYFVCSTIKADNILWVPCTSPLISPRIFSEAIDRYSKILKNGYDSLVSVEPFKRYLWDSEKPVNYELGLKHVPSQQLPDYYVITAGIHIAPIESVLKWSYVYGSHPYMMVVDKFTAADIDDELDFIMAEAWLEHKPDFRD